MRQLSENVFQLTNFGVNSFLYDTPSGIVLFDTSFPGYLTNLEKYFYLYNRSIEDIKHIFLSHPHYDHTGGLAEILQENTGIDVWASESASKLVNEGIPARGLMPSPGLVSAFMNSMIKGMSKDKIAAVESINILKEGKHPVYKEIGVISLPGHTIGHLGFLIEDVDKRVMLAFDALTTFFGPRLMFGYEDLQTGKQSIEKLLEYDFDTLAVGHGKPIEEKVYERLVAKF